MDPKSLLAAAGFVPGQLVFPDAWCGHLPFAAWLMQQLRPSCFVELGTHTGNSYLTFCQAAAAGGGTRCFAVDTWRGDEHAGFYGEEVFEQLRAQHDSRYGGFSSLLRATFDEAVSRFEDRSIGLLHIDGLHTYAAVAHDFATWRPKLAPGALVLLHDTQVREAGFGVWKLWEELSAQYPLHLEFKQSFGLGILQTADGTPLDWLQPATPEQAQVEHYFTALGLAMMERYRAEEQAALVALLRAELERYHASTLRQDATIAAQNAALEDCGARLSGQQQKMTADAERLAAQQRALEQLRAECDEAHVRIAALLQSKSWRLTAPLRFLGRGVRGS